MSKWLDWISVLLDAVYAIVNELGEDGSQEVENTETGERQVLAEKHITDAFKQQLLPSFGINCLLCVEDHNPFLIGLGKPEFIVWVDPMDGTCDFARSQGLRLIAEPISTVISVTPNRKDLTFTDIIAAGLVDLRNGQQWLAEKDRGVFTASPNQPPVPFQIKRQYDKHTPVHTADFWRRINGLVRILWPYGHEVWNCGSVAIDMLQVVLGEADLFYNGLPQISDQGQRGHELGAIYRLLCEAGSGYALDARTGQELGLSEFKFDEQTPVVIGVDRRTVEDFWNTIQKNFQDNEALIRQLWNSLPEQRWSLRPLA